MNYEEELYQLNCVQDYNGLYLHLNVEMHSSRS